jgi:hypothetical protein
MRARIGLGLAAVLVGGCGGGLSIGGTIHGSSFNVVESASGVSGSGTGLVVFLADVTGLCAKLQMNTPGVPVHLLQLGFEQADVNGQATAVTAPNTFIVAEPTTARPFYDASGVFSAFNADGSVVSGSKATAMSGSMHLDKASGSDAAGGGSLQLDTGESVTVAFDHAPRCAL